MTGLAACRCGHPDAAHGHYRAGSECALCDDCARYRRARPPLARRIAAALGLGRKAGAACEIGDDIHRDGTPVAPGLEAEIRQAIDDYYKQNGGRP